MFSISAAQLAILASLPALSLFGDLFVDGSADCVLGDGSSSQPVCTIGDAIDLASSGDTIFIAPGTYTERVRIDTDLTLIGVAGEEATIVDATGLGGSAVTILPSSNTTIEGLTITGGQSTAGGGIRAFSSFVLRNSTVSGNRVETPYMTAAEGGGVFARGPNIHVELDHVTVSDNETLSGEEGFSQGSGVFAQDATLVIRNSTIDGNRAFSQYNPLAETRGAGVFIFRTPLTMSNSTVSNNSVQGRGGGLYALVSPFDLTNSTLSGNRAHRGSAIYKWQGDSIGTLDHVTVTRNRTTILTTNAVVGALTYRNSIIAGNIPIGLMTPPGISPDVGNAAGSLGNNVFGSLNEVPSSPASPDPSDQFGTLAAPLDPELGPLGDNGGPTRTHAVLPGSPALDAASFMAMLPFDQRGLTRPQGSASDIGAFELESYTSLCHGDGGDQLGCTDCPCGNNAAPGTEGGCLNSAGTSALLSARGDASISQPSASTIDLRFGLAGVPPDSFCVLNSGAALAPGAPSSPCFGQNSGIASIEFNGLRCAIANARRFGGRAADADGSVGATNAPWGGEGAPPAGLANAFGGFAAGETRYFQALYREDATALCQRGLNTSQAIEVSFAP